MKQLIRVDGFRQTVLLNVSGSLKIPASEAARLTTQAWSCVVGRLERHKINPNLTITNGNCWRGRAWRDEQRCLVRIGDLHTEPRNSTHGGYWRMPLVWHKDWREHLVGLLAHELWHLFTKQPRGRGAEFDCELVGRDAVAAYRKRMGYTFEPHKP